MTSPKSQTNKKWTSTEESRANWDRIFGKKETCRNGRRVDVNGRDLGVCLDCEGTGCEDATP
jgi:hypothetical protein